MNNIIHHAHSGLRWVALLLLLLTIFKAFSGMSGNKVFTAGDKKLALFTLISVHLQLVLGLLLYANLVMTAGFTFSASMKDPLMRFFSVEHIATMIIAIALITIGYSKAKRATSDRGKFKTIAIFFTIGLILILAMIPWPFMAKFAGFKWF
ncbi:MAG: cytochrome B [Bacteroidota bacterium]|nr:cytochrome B [Bacteroidota bacterium]